MTLFDHLLAVRPRESGGSVASNRLQFQRDWTLCLLLQLHAQPGDYLVLCEYHDDVCVLDSATAPTRITTYQVKTKKSGTWTLTKLRARPKPKKAKKGGVGASGVPGYSMLGKLFAHFMDFPDAIREVHFVSNARFKVPVAVPTPAATDRDRIPLPDLAAGSLLEVRQSCQDELGFSPLPEALGRAFLDVTDLHPTSHAQHALGKLDDFLGTVLTDERVPARAVHVTLSKEIERRSTCENSPTTDLELRQSRGITRDQFDRILATVGAQPPPNARLLVISTRLSAEQVPIAVATDFHRLCQRVELERLNPENTTVSRAVGLVRSVVDELQARAALPASLMDLVTLVAAEPRPEFQEVAQLYGHAYLQALVAVSYV